MVGKKVVGAGQQGKYFWFETLPDVLTYADQSRIEMDSPPHPVMHFGMTGIYPLLWKRGI